MAAPKGLVLYGDSVFLAGLKAALRGYEHAGTHHARVRAAWHQRSYPGT